MSQCADRLKKMMHRQAQLKMQEQQLRHTRVLEIGQLAEKVGILTAPDACVAGLFHLAQQALHTQAPCLQEWAALGARFLKPPSSHHRPIPAKPGEEKQTPAPTRGAHETS